MTPDEERWAEALMVEKQHGEQAATFIASRIHALSCAGDAAGMRRWMEIEKRFIQLSRSDKNAAPD